MLEEDLEDDWACVTDLDLEADLLESEEGNASATKHGKASSSALEQELKAALQRGAGNAAAGAASVDTSLFFAAEHAMHDVSADLHGILAEVETMQFKTAALVAAIAHGPLRPPQTSECGGKWIGLPAKDVFGPNVALPAPPMPVSPSYPSDATNLEDYEQRLAALPSALFIGRELRMAVKALDRYQDAKDINRDNLIVNGREISGARGGYEAAVEAIAEGLRAGEAAVGRETWPSEAQTLAAQLLLGVLNRTTSGFAAFEEVLKLLNCDDVVVVSPESAAAEPLQAAITGGVALGRAHTRYAIHRCDGSGKIAVFDAFFSFRVDSDSLRRLATPEDSRATASEDEIEVPAVVLLQRSS
eukprot:TRINITY_DN8035_c0_g1_i5.p1 TRINITY_DN8035_c0_g1~~TRINITY_DN8035_c0_g1_i5.p1  ORF type:complete len:359 (-),score=88.51 TRINITY_DN8035_c0_g1_i5:166-1242(-)